MAELQPADGGFLWHAIYGGQCHGQPAGGEEGGCKGEPELGEGEQVCLSKVGGGGRIQGKARAVLGFGFISG